MSVDLHILRSIAILSSRISQMFVSTAPGAIKSSFPSKACEEDEERNVALAPSQPNKQVEASLVTLGEGCEDAFAIRMEVTSQVILLHLSGPLTTDNHALPTIIRGAEESRATT